ncbi:hypothetical protein Q3G72_005535 [Acer saccharum]|nr:hypothetical protein Q3G72_005535 [Acer saccharum]
MGDALFSILIDESRDISTKEQMATVLHYVNPNGQEMKRFIGIKYVASTTALSLKSTNFIPTNIVANVVNIVGVSAKRHDVCLEKQAMVVFEALKSGELSNRGGLNEEINLKRSSDTR